MCSLWRSGVWNYGLWLHQGWNDRNQTKEANETPTGEYDPVYQRCTKRPRWTEVPFVMATNGDVGLGGNPSKGFIICDGGPLAAPISRNSWVMSKLGRDKGFLGVRLKTHQPISPITGIEKQHPIFLIGKSWVNQFSICLNSEFMKRVRNNIIRANRKGGNCKFHKWAVFFLWYQSFFLNRILWLKEQANRR